MAAGFLINAFLNEDQNIRVLPGFCQRVRFRKSSCQKCQEICPEKVISLNPGPTIKNGCTDCGLCQNVCPTEVFRHEFHTDRYLLNQARALLAKDRYQPLDEKKRFFVHCQRAQKQNNNSLGLPCLGRITANIILGVALAGFDEAVLSKGICSRCRYFQGEKLLADSMVVSRVLLQSTGLDRFTISIGEKEKKKEAALSRRDIFTKISNNVKNKAASFAYHREKAIRKTLAGNLESKEDKCLSPARELLRILLKQKVWKISPIVKYNSGFPWGRIKIEEKNCSACGICIALCPTRAITKKLENEYQLLYFNSSLCINCSLCKTACPEHAIDFEDDFALADIIAVEATVVAAIQLKACIICGELITVQKSTLCPTCRKRQVVIVTKSTNERTLK
jgi:ferredoxin